MAMRKAAFGSALFSSALLLFVLQPMVARFLLPWFGGGNGVWSATLLFFQGALLLGYGYAHLLVRSLDLRRQTVLHGALLLGSLLWMPLAPTADLEVVAGASPTWSVLGLLVRRLAPAAVLLSSSAPLLQHWYGEASDASPYRLYAVSNFGSLLGLLVYPLAVEPFVGLQRQATMWTAGQLIWIVLVVVCAGLVRRSAGASTAKVERDPDPPLTSTVLWLCLSGVGVVLLLAVTTELATNLAPMPLLWVVPLCLYLLSFIWCFASDEAPFRKRFLALFGLTVVPTLWLPDVEPIVGVWPSVALACVCFFSACMVVHGELAHEKPDRRQASGYYLRLALGGVLGGALVNFVAPSVFDRYWEFPLALFAVFPLTGWCMGRRALARPRAADPLGLRGPDAASKGARRTLIGWTLAGVLVALVAMAPERIKGALTAEGRSFYGRLAVVEASLEGRKTRLLLHGRVRHGGERVDEKGPPAPSLYFSRDSGVGIALRHHAARKGLHVGVVGLGVGTLASYGRAADRFRFYELDPLVATFAREHFRFLGETRADVAIVVGDARLSLARELAASGSHRFDVLVIDAFNAGSIPTHLLTREALALYWAHIAEGGTLALHISNAFLDLGPVVHAHANALGRPAVRVRSEASAWSTSGSTWVLMSESKTLLNDPELRAAASPMPPPQARVWTDDYSPVLRSLKASD